MLGVAYWLSAELERSEIKSAETVQPQLKKALVHLETAHAIDKKTNRIARLAYGQHKGIWRDTPITPARFSKGNYRYFADPLLAQLTAC